MKVVCVTRRKVFPNESVWGLQVTPVDLLGAKTGEGSPSRARLGPWADTSSRAAVQALSQGGVPLPGPLVPGDNTDIPATP